MSASSRQQSLDLLSGPISRTLVLFALPTLGSNLLNSLNGSINSMWVGRYLGESALAATANANLVMFLMFSGMFGMGMAAAMLVGQATGRGDLQQVRRVIGATSGLFVVGGVVIGAFGYAVAPAILRALAISADVFPLALEYLRMMFLTMPSVFLFVLLTMALRGTGDSMTPMWFMLLGSALDVALNPLLIVGPGAFPALGIAGSALATLIASYLSCAALVAYIYAKDLPIRLRGGDWRSIVPDRGVLAVVYGKGLPMGLSSLVMTLSGLAIMGLVNRYGAIAAAAYAATTQLWTYIQLPAMALAAAVTAMAAQNIGAGRWERVEAIHRSGLLLALLLMSTLALAMILTDHIVLSWFLGPDSAALGLAEHIDHLAVWSLVLFGITTVPGAIVRANGAAMMPLVIMGVSYYPVRFGFALGLQKNLDIDSIWWSLDISAAVGLMLTMAYYRWGGWRSIRLRTARPDTVDAACPSR